MAILKDVSWTATGQIVRQGAQFLLAIALARLLSPADFGLLALVTVFTGFAGIFSNFGISSAVIYQRETSDAELTFAFWVNLAVGLIVTCICVAAAPLVGSFYGDARVITLMRISSLTFIFASLGLLPSCLLQKEFRFRELAVADISSTAAGGVLAVTMAFRGWGVWSLAAQSVATALFSAILKLILVRWRPRFRFRWRDGEALWRFGTNLLGFNLVNYWCRNGDNLLVGKFCGAVELGFYSRAYSLMLLPITQVGTVLSAVMFPTLAAMQNSKEAFRKTYLLACQSIAVITFPLMLGLMIEADDFIAVLWGPRWHGVVPIIRVLALAGLGNAVYTTVGWIYTATGNTALMFRWMLISMPIMFASYAAGLPWGAYGVAVAYTIAFYSVLWVPAWVIAGRVIDLSFGDVMCSLAKPLAASLFSGACMLAGRLILTEAGISSSLPRLLLVASLGAPAYVLATVRLRIKAVDQLRKRVSGSAEPPPNVNSSSDSLLILSPNSTRDAPRRYHYDSIHDRQLR